MKIVFMGTPDFAVPSLRILLKNGHEILGVVTTPDKERGRGKQVTYTPVKEFALENNIPVFQPESLRDEAFISALRALEPELFVVVAFRILPPEVFTIPKKGSFNLHGSILPKYRGAAPIQRAIINGEKETGVTTFFLQEKVDTGNIILCEKMPIDDEDDFGTVHDKLSVLGAELVKRTVELIENGNYTLQAQDDSLATGAPKITRETCQIDWNNDAVKIHNLIRGLSPYPGAFFYNKDKQIKIYRSAPDHTISLKPGELYQSKTEAIVGCQGGALRLLELQPEGRKRMTISEFLRGYSLL